MKAKYFRKIRTDVPSSSLRFRPGTILVKTDLEYPNQKEGDANQHPLIILRDTGDGVDCVMAATWFQKKDGRIVKDRLGVRVQCQRGGHGTVTLDDPYPPLDKSTELDPQNGRDQFVDCRVVYHIPKEELQKGNPPAQLYAEPAPGCKRLTLSQKELDRINREIKIYDDLYGVVYDDQYDDEDDTPLTLDDIHALEAKYASKSAPTSDAESDKKVKPKTVRVGKISGTEDIERNSDEEDIPDAGDLSSNVSSDSAAKKKKKVSKPDKPLRSELIDTCDVEKNSDSDYNLKI